MSQQTAVTTMRLPHLHLAQRTSRLAALAVLAVSLTGCQVIDGTPPSTQVRLIDASPDAPMVDIYQNSNAALYNMRFGTGSSYIETGPGTYAFAANMHDTQQQLANVRASLALGGQYTVLIGNISASLQMTVLKDQSTPAPTGMTALRMLNQSTRIGPIDIYLVPSATMIGNVAPLAASVHFGSTATYINLPIGSYSIVATPAGIVPTSATAPLYTGSQVTYQDTSAHTVVFIDQPQAATPALQVIAADDYEPPTAN